MAIPDHPWTKATDDYASVRIAMTVAVAGRHQGVLREVTHESGLNTDEPKITLSAKEGRINADSDGWCGLTSATSLLANEAFHRRASNCMAMVSS